MEKVIFIEKPRRRWGTGVVLVVLLGAGGYWLLRPEPPLAESGPVTRAQPPMLPPSPAPRVAPPSPVAARPAPTASRPEPAKVANAPPSDPQEVFVEQLPKGDGTGLDAFPKPGTKPLKGGLVVPDGYELPPGYVRHYQTTDDGEELPPILMFHPDYNPPGVQLPGDRIVTPDLAPPGMPQKWMEPPPFRKGAPR